ncbi:MAG: hypothetical protein ACXAC5_01525 [Promethearchaeota archaeon]|jgi:DNA-binding PadR family transcriptional regulator
MALPSVTHLQFAVLDILDAKDCYGREIREALKIHKISKSQPAFYQLMARIENDGLVKGWYHTRTVTGRRQIIRERRYRISVVGIRAMQQARNFYLEHTTWPLKKRISAS